MAIILQLTLKTPPDSKGVFVITDGTNDYTGQIPENSEDTTTQDVKQFARDLGQELMRKKREEEKKIVKASKPLNIKIGEVLFERTDEEVV